jgi:hypothetical protein
MAEGELQSLHRLRPREVLEGLPRIDRFNQLIDELGITGFDPLTTPDVEGFQPPVHPWE